MFGKRKNFDQPGEGPARSDSSTEPRRTTERPLASSHGGQRGSGIMAPGMSRRPSLGSAAASASAAGNEGRKLVVGREICLSGEIKTCEKLIVEGRVEADLTDSKLLEISAPGLFKGNASVDNCEISGTFEGELVVHGRLLVRADGRVLGKVYYGELEVVRGGKIIGTTEAIEVEEAAEEPAAGAKDAPGADETPSAETPFDDTPSDDTGPADRPAGEETAAQPEPAVAAPSATVPPPAPKREPRGIHDLMDESKPAADEENSTRAG